MNVLTGRMLCACINATTVELSMPPERNAPERHVGDHLLAYCVAQQRVELCADGFFGLRRRFAKPLSAIRVRRPVRLEDWLARLPWRASTVPGQ